MEDENMTLLYNIDISDSANPVYNVDNSSTIHAFDRVAYQVELLHVEYGHQIVYISMNPFSDNTDALGIPNSSTDALEQQVSNILVRTNVSDIPQGRYNNARIEFSHASYTPLKGASNKKIYCAGDMVTHGCMQFFVNGTCVFAFNNFNNNNNVCDIGIGNAPKDYKDWSFMHNGKEYVKKTINVYVRKFMYSHILPDAHLWKSSYSLDIPLLKNKIEYNFDQYNYNSHNLPFDRIGFYLHLGSTFGEAQYIWVSMDAFSSQHGDATLPGLNGLIINKKVSNLEILSSVHGYIYQPNGHIRFSPYNYAPDSSGRVGYNDTMLTYGEYGCFQIFDGDPTFDGTHALISYNNFYGIPDLGIGNYHEINKNWTLTNNAHIYNTRRLEIATQPCRVCYYVDEIKEMKLLYSFNLSDNGPLNYVIDNSKSSINRKFTRASYFIELNDSWMYVSFDCISLDDLGIPSKSVSKYVQNACIQCNDGTKIQSKSKIWIKFTPYDYIVSQGSPGPELFTGTYGCMQIGYNDNIMWSASGLNGTIQTGFFNNEVPASSYLRKRVQLFISRHDYIPDIVFLVSGQSNSVGTGGYYEPLNADDQMHENILSWNMNDKSWDIANLERHMGTKPLLNQCFAFHFAKKFIARFPNKKIGIVICGAPGQSISRWSKTQLPKSTNEKKDSGDIFDKTIVSIKEALAKSNTTKVEGILWHQGESDYDETHEYYRRRLINIISEYRRQLNSDTVFIAGELLRLNSTWKQNVVLRELNHNKDRLARCAFSKNLTHCGDELHFSTQSHRDLGDMYFEQYMIIQYMNILK